MKIGIISPAEIAMRRFLPALQKSDFFEFAGIAINSKNERFTEPFPPEERMKEILEKGWEKARAIVDNYGGVIYDGYETIIDDPEIEAVYIPLPPALHFKWAKLALQKGKHVLVEKPSTVTEQDSIKLVEIANRKGLALHENYMFVYHKQLEEIKDIIESGEIGDVRLFRISFGFPRRRADDFRYNKSLGGGALLDAGGYTIKYASYILGASTKFLYAQSNYTDEFEVDLYGSAALTNDETTTVQVSFGMDNEYRCDLEAWGNKGYLKTDRVLTAPAGYIPTLVIHKEGKDEIIRLSADDTFYKSLIEFQKCIIDSEERKNEYLAIIKQAHLVENFKTLATC